MKKNYKYLLPASWCLNDWMQKHFNDDSFITNLAVFFVKLSLYNKESK